MNLGFIILAHNQPEAIRRLVDTLATGGNRVVIHFDSSASATDHEKVAAIAALHPEYVRVISKVHCVWGEWSLVEAVLLALHEFKNMPEPPDYIHLMSGADVPIRPIDDLKEFLRRNSGKDFIECCDITRKAWVKGGLSRERLRFYFPFNFKTSRKAFDRMVRWQRKLKIRRRMPLGLKPFMGSQWWTLRWSTCLKVLEYSAANPQVSRFFKSTWIPDESYFQTIIGNIIPQKEIAGIQLMFHHLTPTGRPYIFYNDHLPLLQKLPHFFVRKVSPDALELKEKLSDPSTHRSRIPVPALLEKARELVRNQIDENHKFVTSVPGHHTAWYAPELKSEKRPLVLFFLTEDSQLPYVRDLIMANACYHWLGRPFAPKAIDAPGPTLACMGLTRGSWQLRDAFRQQFLHYLMASSPGTTIAAAAVIVNVDNPDIEAMNLLESMLPILVKSRSIKSLTGTNRFLAHTHATPAWFFERMLTLEPGDLAALVDDLPGETTTKPLRKLEDRAASMSSPLDKPL